MSFDFSEPPSARDGSAQARADLTSGLMSTREGLAPAFDAADGMRADLIARGWSPALAEGLAGTWLQRVLINLTPLIGGNP